MPLKFLKKEPSYFLSSKINIKVFFIQDYTEYTICFIKGTVSVISSDPPCKYGNDWFTTVALKSLSDQVWIRYPCL